ncbi:glycoside hydrolase family 97 catalytic domain-containing protein [Catenulispora rubra]|uniref:glycoside hydrolase family 97 catalytic domain-containing protein n=1 Tax=Catenulispora rubra TaxID=280293 RepID=UPI001892292E|nr:glycoside hydrolase family 97 protein [Catenulispora rubra]
MRRILPVIIAVALWAAAALAIPLPAKAASSGSWTVNDPSGSGPAAVIALTNGQLTFSAQRSGTTVLSAPIGITANVGDFSSGLNFASRSDTVTTQSYTMTTGKQRSRSATYNQTTLAFTGSNGAAVDLVVVAGAEGVAYRWVLPESGAIQVTADTAGWTVPTGSPAWLNDMASDYQGQWRTTTAGEAAGGNYAYPALFNVGGTYVSVAETDLDGRYSATTLTHAAGTGTFTTTLESQPSTTGPLSTPWRVAAVGTLNTVFASQIEFDLAPPSKVSDTSWIKPGQVAWSWLTQGTGDENQQKQYVDFAAQNGWPYDLVDAGWSASWIPDLVSYAKARNVNILLWYDSSTLQTDAALQQAMQQAANWGVAGVKIDYVFNHTQPTLQWYDKVLSLTASLHLMVNFHGTEVVRGMQRTWPQVMSNEAVYGAEQKQDNASFDTILPYTRNQVASMDFTPVDFSTAMGNTTLGHQVGMAVAFESGWQHYSDNPASYNSQPLALSVLDRTPTVWDESRLLGGTPGQEVYMARRYGSTWYLGGLSAVGAKTFTTGLSFLGSGQYFAETVRDGSSGGLTRDTATVTSAGTLSVPEAANGGFVTIICPATPGITACPNPTGSVASNDFSVAVSPSSGSVAPGSSATATVNTAVVSGSAQSVSLSASGLPSGATASFSPSSVNAGGSSTLTISTSSSTPAGTYTVAVTGSAASATHSAIYTLTVTGSGGGISNGSHTLIASGKALDDPNHSTATGTQLITWAPTGGGNQSWVFTQQSDGSYQIVNSESNLCIDVSGASTSPGAQVIQWTCHGGANQRWIITPLAGGGYTIASQNGGLLLTTASTSDGSLVTQQANTGSALQHWTIS